MRRIVLGLLAGASLFLLAQAETHAQDASPAGQGPRQTTEPTGDRRTHVVARVGGTEAVTVGGMEDRIAAVAPFQLVTFGATADAVRRHFLMEVLIPEALFARGAETQELQAEARTGYDLQRARSGATLRAIRDRVGAPSAISMQDVQKYYDENRSRYDTPERYQIWRILCRTQGEAQSVLEQAKRDPTPKTFGDLAREHSLDKATNLREGNLGFLTPAGSSNEPGLHVDPAVVRAAQGVHDGELVPAPVAEGEYFAVVWRRGTVPAMRRTPEEAAASIRDAIGKARIKHETDKLIASLRAAKLRDLNESLLDTLELPQARDH
jgi:peptidyl-prolyl cis-trans isomerase C